jgi:hypothetical protein
MNNFLNSLETISNMKRTENGALAQSSTHSALVDLFGTIGALRSRHSAEVIQMFRAAFGEDALLATKMAFYARDIRGGLGERETFRIILKELANNHPNIVRKNMANIPEMGRWDDLFVLFDTSLENEMMEFVKETLFNDGRNVHFNKPVSLCAKWMPSSNASSANTRKMAQKFIKYFHITERRYRKLLSVIRAYIKVVETPMSAKEWEAINYETCPSRAMFKYRNAFKRNDTERYEKYIENVNNGKSEIKASTVYPYDLVRAYLNLPNYLTKVDDTIEAQWKNLPNFVEGENNFLVMADVSGSMRVPNDTAISASIGLAIYFAQRNKGAFAGKYLTFSAIPKIASVSLDDTLFDCVSRVMRTDIGYNTNLERAFRAILMAAELSNCPASEMPKSLVIITDMEIDDYSIKGGNFTFLDTMKERFAEKGYELPNVVFWNVNARHNTFHALASDSRVQLVSGYAPNIFKSIVEIMNSTPYEAMLKVLSNPRYDCITI